MEVAFIQLITGSQGNMEQKISTIPKGQLCQAFDPILILPEKTVNICDPMHANTSCICQAYVYVEGIHGKRFLCDYHYYYEYNINEMRTPQLLPQIFEYVVDEREKVKETFSKESVEVKELGPCWCGAEAYVEIESSEEIQYFCNFHFRKLYYRYLLHGQIIYDGRKVHDQRFLIKHSIEEDSRRVKTV